MTRQSQTFLMKVDNDTLPLAFRLQLKVDNFRLKQYKKIADKIPELEYKVNNPRGWLADQIVDEASVYLDKILQRTAKGKRLYPWQVKKTAQLQMALTLITTQQIGRKWKDATDLMKKAVPVVMSQVAKLVPQEIQ